MLGVLLYYCSCYFLRLGPSLSPELTDWLDWLATELLRSASSTPHPQHWGLQVHTTTPGLFYVGSWNLNLGPYISAASRLPI